MTTMLYTVGGRDILPYGLKEKGLPPGQDTQAQAELRFIEDTRKKAKEVLDEWERSEEGKSTVREHHRIKQLLSCLTQVQADQEEQEAKRQRAVGAAGTTPTDASGHLVDRLILLVSNQPEWGNRLRGKDTLYAGKLAKRLLGANNDWGSKVRHIKVVCIEQNGDGIDPSSYDDCFGALRLQVSELLVEEQGDVYVCPTSGTPAMSMALIMAGVLEAGSRCKVLYVPEGTDATVSPISARFLRLQHEQRLSTALQRHDYAGAAQILNEAEVPSWLQALAQAGAARLNFDFTSAKGLFGQAVEGNSVVEELVGWFGRDAAFLAGPPPPVPALLVELAGQAGLIWDAGRYSDFLGRVSCFIQNAALSLITPVFGFQPMPREQVGKGLQAGKFQALRQTVDVWAQKESDSFRRELLEKPWYNTSLDVVLSLLGNAVSLAFPNDRRTSVQKERHAEALRLLGRLDGLRKLRNGVMHTLRGLSRADISEKYAGKRDNEWDGGQLLLELREAALAVAALNGFQVAKDRRLLDWPEGLNAAIETMFKSLAP